MQEMQETQVRSLGQENPLKEHMATPSSIVPWRIPWTEEPDSLQSTGSQRVHRVTKSPQGRKESDTTKVTEHNFFFLIKIFFFFF